MDIDAFAKLSPTALADVLTRDRVMDPGLRPLWSPMPRLAGPAYPVACPAGDNLMLHVAIHRAPPGSVIVCAAGDSNWAMAGGNVCAYAQQRSIAGFVVDGVIRDLAETRERRFPDDARGLGQGAQCTDRRADTEPRNLMDPVFSAVLLGFVLGLQHATDPDHLVAVATILTRERRFAAGALVGVLWGLGHTATLALAGVAIVGLRLTISAEISSGLELLVAAMLILLGALRLRDVASGLDAVPPTHLVADHDHSHVEAVHSHPHAHGADVHAHPHVHPSRRLLAALGQQRGGLPLRALLVGAVHGVAGSAAVSLLVL